MKKIFTISLFLFLMVYDISVFSDEIEIRSEVISVDPEFEFFVVKAGEDAGVELGDALLVHRDGETIAEGYIIEVRQDVSAAEILHIKPDGPIREGDSVLIVKKEEPPAEEVSPPKVAKSRWTAILGAKPKEEASSTLPAPAGYTSEYSGTPGGIEQGKTINITLHQNPDTVFSYARIVLMENGYTIISSNRAIRALEAAKSMELSLLRELWADAVSAIDHKVVISLDIKDSGDFSELSASSFREHFQKGKYIKRSVAENSKYYNELIALVSEIKKRSEY